ncbi:MAG: preprotein translocase subunit SecY [Candidatus Pacebacteria bacterium]|nr:preprotein translocase subunit SecY [Candidatus Paceibacterota bacterium]
MLNKIAQIFKVKDIRSKIFMTLLWLIIFRLLAIIPIPGVNAENLKNFLNSNQLFGFLNIFSGGSLSRLSVMMLGVGPYITSTIIMQLLTMVFPRFKAMYNEEGSAGKAKFNRYSRLLMVPLAALQGFTFLKLLQNQGVITPLSLFEVMANVVVVVAGSVILMWIGEIISEYKIGNGTSLIILSGIVSGIPSIIQNAFVSYDAGLVATYIAFVVLSVVIIAGIVFVNQGERRIAVSYSKRIKGNKMYGGSMSHLPLKVNQAGVIPIIFAISIMLFPQFLAQIASAFFKEGFIVKTTDYINAFFNNQAIYSIAYFLLVVIFTYFYTAITFDSKEIAKNLQRSGAFIPGIRPGDPSAEFLSHTTKKVTFFGAMFLGIVAILPNITTAFTGLQILSIGGTSLLIVVSVALETMKQLNSQLVAREYEGFE